MCFSFSFFFFFKEVQYLKVPLEGNMLPKLGLRHTDACVVIKDNLESDNTHFIMI